MVIRLFNEIKSTADCIYLMVKWKGLMRIQLWFISIYSTGIHFEGLRRTGSQDC